MKETKEMRIFHKYKDRTLKIAYHILEGKTIRQISDILNISKSTVHYDIKNRLKVINPFLYQDVDKKLKENYQMKHLKGGESTRKKYENMKMKRSG